MNKAMDKIKGLQKVGFFGSLDVQMAGLVSRMLPAADENLLIAAALASRAINQGHACVDLEKYAGREWADILVESLPISRENEDAAEDDEGPGVAKEDYGKLPNLGKWIQSLDKSVVGTGCETDDKRKPFVLNGSRLYMRRYWDYERIVEKALKNLNKDSGINFDESMLSKYFKESDAKQKEAATKAIKKRLSILSGGPGTGKTYTVARVVALLAEKNLKSKKKFDVRIAAPTGKAAVRMVESIKDAKADLREEKKIEDVILNAIPEKASTIHSLLESKYNSPYFKHDSKNPLTADMVIIDEASMVDLPLMAKLLDALPEKCMLMLVGDIDQLASVEPGRVYGDVCQAAREGKSLAGCLTRLTKSWRFPEDSAIGKVSRLINAGSCDAWKTLKKEEEADSQHLHLQVFESEELLQENSQIKTMVEQRFADFLKAKTPKVALDAASNFRILCALRKGPYGVKRMNRRVEKILSEKGLEPGGRFYDHKLIMVKVNTPALNLYNGDVGVVLAKDGAGAKKKEFTAWFYDKDQDKDKDKDVRPVPVNLLPDHETAFAMTVHKSQGSEFPYVALILPGDDKSPILTRELLYTGMTRVKIDDGEEKKTGKLTMWCSEASFEKAVTTKTTRTTGLFAATQEKTQ